VHGATIGIVGMGGIGSEVAKRARGFGMRIVYNSRTRKPTLEKRYRMEFMDLDGLLQEADFVTLHAPLTAETRHMMNERTLRLMKPTAVLGTRRAAAGRPGRALSGTEGGLDHRRRTRRD
jgi:glyoxylate reductase